MTLVEDLQKLIDASHAETWADFDTVRANAAIYGLSKSTVARWHTPGEPAFVSKLLTHSVSDHLSRIIQRHLPSTLCSDMPLVSGVFIHQKPKIRLASSRAVIELGDLLLVRQHFQTGCEAPEGRAILLQAKRSTAPNTGVLAGNEAHQFDLYADWRTPFNFKFGHIAPPPSGRHWTFEKGPGSHHDSGFFGIVSADRTVTRFPENCAWAIGRADVKTLPRSVCGSHSLARALGGLIKGSYGRRWDYGAPETDHWSNFVENILERSGAWTYPLQRIGSRALPRRRDALSLVEAHSNRLLVKSFFEGVIEGKSVPSQSLDEMRERSMRIKKQSLQWASSISGAGSGDDNGLSDNADVLERPGGLPILYMATFGEGKLMDIEST